MRLKDILSIGLVFGLVGCGQYKSHFRNRSQDDQMATANNKVNFPNGMNGLSPSHRYDIPAAQTTKSLVDLLPPGWEKPTKK